MPRFSSNWACALHIRFSILITFLLLASSSLRHVHVTAANSSSSSNNDETDDAMRLLRDVIDSHDVRLRPVRNRSLPIKVDMTYNIINLQEINEINQRIAVNVWVNFSWWDEIRTWNPEDYGGCDVIHPFSDNIWLPRTILINSVDKRDVFGVDHAPLSVYSSGATRWYVGGLYYFVCAMDLTHFPFDEQTCSAKVMSTNLGEEIEFIPVSTEVRARDYLGNGEWHFKSSRVTSQKFVDVSNESLAFVDVSLTFQRRAKFYILIILLPILCMSFLSLFAFVVPKESGDRSSFAITVLLSLSFYMVTIADNLPANSDTFPILGVYITSLMTLNMLSVLIIVCQQRMTGSSSTSGSNDDSKYIDGSRRTHSEREEVGNEPRIESLQNDDGTFKLLMNKIKGGEDRNTMNKLGFSKPNQVAPRNDLMMISNEKADNPTRSHINIKPKSFEDRKRIPGMWCAPSDTTVYNRNERSLLQKIKDVLLAHDDLILMAVFTSVWALLTLIYLSAMDRKE